MDRDDLDLGELREMKAEVDARRAGCQVWIAGDREARTVTISLVLYGADIILGLDQARDVADLLLSELERIGHP